MSELTQEEVSYVFVLQEKLNVFFCVFANTFVKTHLFIKLSSYYILFHDK